MNESREETSKQKIMVFERRESVTKDLQLFQMKFGFSCDEVKF